MDPRRQINRFVDYFRAGEKEVSNHAVGLEFEYLILRNHDLAAVPYFGERGILALMQRLTELGWNPVYEGEFIIGLDKEDASISIEPGGQMELAVSPQKRLHNSEDVYRKVMGEIIPVLDEWDQVLVAVGYQPVTPIEEIPLLPKQRYQWMYSYLTARGKYARHMMKGTASTQVCVDYADEKDYAKKSRVISFLSPFIYAVFDNSPFFEEAEITQAARCAIWSNCDPERCGFPIGVFSEDYSYIDYASFILNQPSLLVLKDGYLRFHQGDKPVKEYFDPNDFSDEELDYLLSMCFTDVRTRQYLEIRMGDSLPYPLNFAYAAFWKGLLYDAGNLQSLYLEARKYSQGQIEGLKDKIIEQGIYAWFDGMTVLDKFRFVLEQAKHGLSPNEKSYLAPLEELINRKLRPKDITLAHLALGKRRALDWCILGKQLGLGQS